METVVVFLAGLFFGFSLACLGIYLWLRKAITGEQQAADEMLETRKTPTKRKTMWG